MSLSEVGLLIVAGFIALAVWRRWKPFHSRDGEPYSGHRMQGPSSLLAQEERMSENLIALMQEVRDVILEAEAFIRDPAHAKNGVDLANRLQFAAIGLGSSKATEFSPDNEKLALLAAKVALLTFGRYSSELARFERGVYYYNAFPSTTIGAEYDAFKASL